jgi:hypothetical protein
VCVLTACKASWPTYAQETCVYYKVHVPCQIFCRQVHMRQPHNKQYRTSTTWFVDRRFQNSVWPLISFGRCDVERSHYSGRGKRLLEARGCCHPSSIQVNAHGIICLAGFASHTGMVCAVHREAPLLAIYMDKDYGELIIAPSSAVATSVRQRQK